MSDVEIETSRAQWASANDRLEATRADQQRYDRLHAQVGAVAAELRRRIGDMFTLRELVEEYARAERWSRDAAAEVAGRPVDLQEIALVEDAAFHQYARGAVDYKP